MSAYHLMQQCVSAITILAVAGCGDATRKHNLASPNTAVKSVASIVVDEDHKIGASGEPKSYKVPACSVLKLDVTRYDDLYDKSSRDTIQVIEATGEGIIYAADWTDSDTQVLSSQTLKWIGGEPGVFARFKPDTVYVLGIGKSRVDADGTVALRLSWAAKIETHEAQ